MAEAVRERPRHRKKKNAKSKTHVTNDGYKHKEEVNHEDNLKDESLHTKNTILIETKEVTSEGNNSIKQEDNGPDAAKTTKNNDSTIQEDNSSVVAETTENDDSTIQEDNSPATPGEQNNIIAIEHNKNFETCHVHDIVQDDDINKLVTVQSTVVENQLPVHELESDDIVTEETENIKNESINNINFNDSSVDQNAVDEDLESNVSTDVSNFEYSEVTNIVEAVPTAPPKSISLEHVTNIDIEEDHEAVVSSAEQTINTQAVSDTVKASTRLKTDIVHKKVYAAEVVAEEEIKPFTEEQLNHFYFNAELPQLEFFIDEFLKNATNTNEFHELIDVYYKSRKKLVTIQEKIKSLQEKVELDGKYVWTINQCIATAEGICGCGVNVEQKHKYQSAHFVDDKCQEMNGDLYKLRSMVHEVHELESYNSQVSKIRVDNYIYKLYGAYPILLKLPGDCPITASLPHHLDPNIIPILRELQDCISVLFIFKRRGYLEEQFDNDTTTWLNILVATLQRVGTLPDSFFLLNHLLRCPPGMISSLSRFIQFPSFNVHQLLQVWDRPQVHHFVVMLATLTLPVRSRKEFLSKYDVNRKMYMTERSISWTLVEEDKEEDEHIEDSWSLMREQDLLSIFEQFPFNELFASLLNLEKSDGKYTHSPTLSSSNDVMRLLAFTSCMVKLLGQIFDTYNLLRYRQFIKQISRTIRLITQVVSDHWIAYRNYRMDVIGDNFNDFPKMVNHNLPQFTLQRLQLEFDNFFLRASKRIISSHSSGAVQFLSTMPFEAVSLSSMWIMLHMILDQEADFSELTTRGPEDLPCVRTLEVSPGEGIFLLTALSNMAISRSLEDCVFIETVAKLILEVSFLNSSLTDLYSKNGHDLLASIARKHPVVVSALLDLASKLRNQLQKVLTYIFDSMPLHLWKPTSADMELIRSWLLSCSLTSEENLLARMLLAKLNYGYNENEMKMFLPRNYHFMIAILLVEAYGISFPDYAGGIQNLNYAALGIIGQVSKMAVSSYNKIMYSQAHTEFLSWSWDIMLMLKLHESDISQNIEQDDDSVSDQREFGPAVTWSFKTLCQLKNKASYDLDLEQSAELLNVQLAVQSNGVLAMYVAFAMTKQGHFVDQFLSKGIGYLVMLKDAYHYDAVMRIISNIAPLFVNCPEKLANDSFMKLLLTLIHIDVDKAGYTEKLWQYFIAGTYSHKFAALVTSHVLTAKQLSDSQGHKSIKFWLFLLINLPFWSRDCGILYQIDNLCKASFMIPNGLNVVIDMFTEEYKGLISSQEPRGLLSSVISWISNNPVVSLMPAVTPDFCYYAYVILTIEMKFEEAIGLWREISTEMVMDSSTTIEQAYKKATLNIKSLFIPPLHMLSIYRWGEQAMSTPKDHPFLPIMWQTFFIIFLQKPSEDSGLPSRTGIGLRFFQSFAAASVSKKMKASLCSTASYHQEKSTPKDRSESRSSQASTWTMTEKEHVYSEQFHLTLSQFYQGLSLWLEESRLHDANLYLSSLPDAYNPDLLLKIFQGNKDLWFDYMDKETIFKELETLSSLWSHSINRAVCMKRKDSVGDMMLRVTAGQRITKRLNDESNPLPPPPLVYPEPAVPITTFHILLTRPRLVQDVGHNLETVVQYAKNASTTFASHVGLDGEYVELIPDLYEMVTRTMTVWIPCEGKRKRRKGMCSGPAQVNISFRELRLRERISELLKDNRNAFNQLIENCTTQIPVKLCQCVVHVENIIEKLSDGYDTLNELQRQELQDSARRLFYLLAQLIDDDVKRCPPAMQFFSTGVEILGQKFIADNSTEQLPLLEAILTHNPTVVFLAPHFSPFSSLENYVMLYSKIISFMAVGNETTVFVLLSKFDMNNWLASSPSLSDQVAMVTLIMMALNKIGANPNTEGLVVLDIIRGQMMILLSSNVNEFYSKILLELLSGSTNSTMPPISWDDFNSCVGFDKSSSPRDKSPLLIGQVKESIPFLAGYFQNNVDKLTHHLDTLYEIWQPYTKPLNKLLFGLFELLIYYELEQANAYNKDQILRDLWETIISVYQPWILPRTPGKIWTLLRMESVLSIIQSFTEAIRYVIDTYSSENGYCVLLNTIWSYYYQSIVPCVKEDQSLELFHSLLTTLPWSMFCPSVQELSFVLQSHDSNPTSFRFFGCLLSEIDWTSVVASYTSSGNSSAISRLHQQLLHIFVMMAANKTVLDTSASKLVYLFTQAKTFNWETLGLEDTAQACKWYAENADSSLILDKESSVWSSLDLFLEVCGYHGIEDSANEIAIAKRNLYVHVLVTLLTRCSSNKNRAFDFRFVVDKLLQSVESTISFNSANPMQELVTHSSTCLNLLNTISSGPVFDTINSSIESHLLSTQCGMLVLAFVSAASRSLASIERMVSLLETSISCHFARLADDELKNSWIPILKSFIIPELNKEEFIKESLKQKAILTLYSYNLHRIPHAQSQGEQLGILADAVQWCSKIQPDKECESKLMLLWLQIFDIVRMQIPQYQYQNQLQQLAKYMLYLAHACQQHGEDKTYTGVLGAIGIGRKSALSKEFRLSAKALQLFLLCQLPSSGVSLRTSMGAPGAIRIPYTEPRNHRATTEAEKVFTTFQSFLKNKSHLPMKEQVQWILDFVSNPQVNVTDGCSLLVYICRQFFDKENFIAATVF